MKEYISINKRFIVLLANFIIAVAAMGQNTLKMGVNGGPSGSGPSTTAKTVTLYKNGTTAYSPALTVTYTISNQQFPNNSIEGISDPGITFGGNLKSNGNGPMGSQSYYRDMDGISGPLSNMFSGCLACGPNNGIDVTTDKAINIFTCSDALINSSSVNQYALDARVYYGDVTITFNRPVSNPVIHVVGLGATMTYDKNSKVYFQGFATELDLVGSLTLTKLDGNSALDVSSNQIKNSATWIAAPSQGLTSYNVNRYAASGSIVVNGTNITSVTFKTYLRGDGGRITDFSGNVVSGGGDVPIWSTGSSNPTGTAGFVSGDTYLLGVSLEEEADEICDNGIDDDGDGLVDCEDPDCYLAANSGDTDTDGDGIGNICDVDSDNDGILDIEERCSSVSFSTTYATRVIFNTGHPNVTAQFGDPNQMLGAPDWDGDLTDNPEQFLSVGLTGSYVIVGWDPNVYATNSGDATDDISIVEIGVVESSIISLKPTAATKVLLDNQGSLTPDADGFYQIGVAGGATVSFDIDAITSNAFSQGELLFDEMKITSNLASSNTTPGTDGPDIDAVEVYYSISCPERDSDNDGIADYLDIYSDDDGIPDNVEGQTTAGYIPPSGIDADNDGLDDAYDSNTSSSDPTLSAGITPVNTDGTDNVDYLDSDSDNDGVPDIQENNDPQNTLSGNDTDNDGLDDNFDDNNVTWDVNDDIDDPNPSTLGDADGDVAADGNNAVPLTGDLDYRDNVVSSPPGEICGNGLDDDGDGLVDCEDPDCYLAANSGDIDTDGDGIGNICDIDNDGDGILDELEQYCDQPSVANSTSGSGIYQDQLYFFNWTDSDFADGLDNGDNQTFNLPNGLTITATFSNVVNGSSYVPSDMNTWSGATLWQMYNTNGNAEALYGADGESASFTVNFTATKNGYTYPLDFITLDPEATNNSGEYLEFTTDGSAWQVLETYGNGGVWTGVGTKTVRTTDTEQSGGNTIFYSQNASQFDIDINAGGREGIAFGIWLRCDSDNDGLVNDWDIDADDDGIPDNVEGQTTAGYIPPSGIDADNDGLDDAYDSNTSSNDPTLSAGITPVNTDGTDELDYLDSDSDNDGIPDIQENNDPQNTLSGNDIDNDGLDDNFDDNNVTWDVNDDIDDPNPSTLGDADGDVAANGNNAVPLSSDVDYRDAAEICNDGIDNNGDGLIDCADSDCIPIITNVTATTLSCPPGVYNGQIVITATGSGTLSYSITNVANYQSSNTFSNLGPGQYTIRVRNDSGCTATYTASVVRIDSPNCIEICNDGIDNDGDGLVDCDDPDCEGVGTGNTIDNQ